jgi:hypothetical protein
MKIKTLLFSILIASIILPTITCAQKMATGGGSVQGHSLSVCSNRTIMAWGDNYYGQLGNGTNASSLAPTPVTGLSNVLAVAACSTATIALTIDSTIWTWGENTFGQLGIGNNTDSNIPVQVSSLTGVVAIAGGDYYSLALKSDGTVWAWGSNWSGELGNGTNTQSNVPVPVDSLTGIIAIDAEGASYSLALKNDGTVWAWGSGIGIVPVQVASVTNVIAISVSFSSYLALKNDGTVWTWTGTNVPTQITSLTGIVEISSGWGHSLALKGDGSVWSWGDNYMGQLGNGNYTNSSVPVQLTSLTNVTSISAGGEQSLCLKNDGSLWAFGDNYSGQLGDSTTINSNVPVQVNGLCLISSPTCTANYTTVYDTTLNTFTLTIDSLTSATAVSYHWDFGDGTTSSFANPTHIYTADSLYNICMEITNASGDYCSYCSVIGMDSAGNIIRTGGFIINVQSGNTVTDINQQASNIQELIIYPNPNNGLFTVKAAYNTNIEIYDLLGDIVYKTAGKQKTSTEIDLSKSPKGIYFVKLIDGNVIQTRKIIVQ